MTTLSEYIISSAAVKAPESVKDMNAWEKWDIESSSKH